MKNKYTKNIYIIIYLLCSIKNILSYVINKILKNIQIKIHINNNIINNRQVDKEIPYFIIISSIYENIGLPLLYVISIDKISQLFDNIYKIVLKWRKLITIGLNPIEALMLSAVLSKSKKWRELIINYITLQKIGGSATEFFNRKVEEALNEIRQAWKRYHDNILFIIEVFMITIFSTITLLLLSILLSPATIKTNIALIILFITVVTIISIIVIDNIMPIKLKHYTPKKYTIIVSSIFIIIIYQIINWKINIENNAVATSILLLTISTLPLTLENLAYYVIYINKNNQSILNLLDYIITAQRYSVSLTRLKKLINSSNTLTRKIKELFNSSLNGENTKGLDYKEKIIVSIIIGLKHVGLIPYELLLRLRNIIGDIIDLERSTRKTLNVITILTMSLPIVLMIILIALVHSLAEIQSYNAHYIMSLGIFTEHKTKDIYLYIYVYSASLSFALNTIISKAVDLSIRSYWRTNISILVLTLSYYYITSLIHLY